jgi:type 1 fimbria pilin
MKTIVTALLLLLLAFTARAAGEPVAAPDEPPATADGSVTMTGEIVDLHCYTSRGARGEEHAGCANACISRDVPAGFLAGDGTLYLLVNEKPVSVKDRIAGKAGKKVTVRGKVVEKSGVKALQLASVE